MNPGAQSGQRGVILIEALIGILIFSIGILALIGMQATAMKNTADARYRSEAAFLANQIIGQIWVDRVNIDAYKASGYAPRDKWETTVAATLPGVVAGGALAPTINFIPGNKNQVIVIVQWRQPGEVTVRNVQMITWIN